MNKSLAIIIPVYNEQKMLMQNMQKLIDILDGLVFSITLVDDGSKDESWSEIEKLSRLYGFIQGYRLSRNFGKEIAIFAGLENTDADLYIVMDSDLQHPPSYISEMLSKMEETGCDIVECVKQDRGRESLKYKLIAKSYYKLLKLVSGLDMSTSSDFKLITRDVVDALKKFGESNIFFRGLVDWTGFYKERISFCVDERKGDTSRFSTKKLVMLGLDAMFSYTSTPLYITIVLGLVFMIGAVILGIQTLYMYISHNAAGGFSTVILLMLITGSFVLLSLGIIGAYISRIYNEVKRRPRYIISKKAASKTEDL